MAPTFVELTFKQYRHKYFQDVINALQKNIIKDLSDYNKKDPLEIK